MSTTTEPATRPRISAALPSSSNWVRGRRPIADHRVDGHEQLAGYGRQRSFFRFAPAAFYERLVGRGNPKKAALAAVARKLLVAINAMIRDGRGWQLALIVQPSCC